MLQVARTIGMGTARIAEANRELVIRTLTQPGDTERDLALRLAAAAEHMLPLVGPTIIDAFQLHMLEQVRRDVIGTADLASGELGGDDRHRRLLRRPGRVHQARRGGRRRAARPRRRAPGGDGDGGRRVAGAAGEDDRRRRDAGLRRRRGDAARRRCDLVEAAEEEGEEFPSLRAGIARGPVIGQAGDYYGRSVNLASRITGVARPGSVLVDTATRRRRGGLRLLPRRRAPPQGNRRPHPALPGPAQGQGRVR